MAIINEKTRFLAAHKLTFSRFTESVARYLWEGQF